MDDEAASLGPLRDNFSFKKRPDGTFEKTTVVCKLCKKEFAYHRSYSSLKYHLNAKHVAASTAVPTANFSVPSSGTNKRSSQPTLDQMTGFRAKISKSTSEKLSNSLAKWIATDCRPLSVVEDRGLQSVLQIATSDPAYELPCRKTMASKIRQLYDEKQSKQDILNAVDCVALTGDHWTSVSNSNYLGVTAHTVCVVNKVWQLASFVLTVEKVNNRHYAVNCTDHFFSVAESWKIEQKVTTIGTDCARNMMAAARQLPFQHMPCVAHILQRSITVCLDSCGFNDVLAKCRKIVCHFRHSPANTMELYKEQRALDQENEPLIQDVSTRWNSTLFMIRRLLKNKEAVKATLDKQRHKLVLLSAAEWTNLEKLAAILEPCRHVTDLLGGETYVSCSAVLPVLRFLDHTMKVSDEDSTYIVKFKTESGKLHLIMIGSKWLQCLTLALRT
ncbi:E3 SUMO-protein ligase ZBED1-like [Trichomycterus rosablanca]|uniref:E3 SUMO-protein ligase ZBED1-like n=1 Tax=Trichomycterus rosablanca TaxID=2290929 RepID=UPI002F3563A3